MRMDNDIYNRIIREGAMSESIARLIFTDDPDTARRMLLARALVRTSYRICIFYSALVQAYIISKAIHNDCVVSELPYSGRLTAAVKRNWSDGEDVRARTENSRAVFSFLLDCCDGNAGDIVSDDGFNVIRRFRDAYERFVTPSRRALGEMNENDLLALLHAFPLLSTTTVDFSSCTFSFNTDDGVRYEIASSPFVFFVDSSVNAIVQQRTSECLVFTGVSSGNNGQLLFSVTELQVSSSVKQQTKLIRRQAAQNETLQIICKAVEMKAEWYSVDECWCDLAFLDHLTDVTRTVLSRFWKGSSARERLKISRNIAPKLQELFIGTDISERISQEQSITLENIDSLFYELYINCGAFKTMSGLLLDYPGHEFGSRLFDIYMQVFEDTGRIDGHKRKLYEDECRSNIESRLKKLSEIVRQGTVQYDNRMRALKAEWRAYCVLKAAGIHASNLFTDEEEILSSDDYYDMIRNPSSTIRADLNSVLLMLIELYNSMLNNLFSADETTLMQGIKDTRSRVCDYSTDELFDELKSIIAKLNESSIPEQHLGRKEVCSLDELSSYYDEIMTTIDATSPMSDLGAPRKQIFISYAHEDKPKVMKYYQLWRQKGYDFFFDEDGLSAGDRWQAAESITPLAFACHLSPALSPSSSKKKSYPF